MTTPRDPIPDLAGRTALVTGTRGLAFQVAKALASKGAQVIMAGRDLDKGREAIAAIGGAHPLGKASFELVDLASLASVRQLGSRLQDGPPLDLLINNAGIMSPPKRKLTADGFELQFGVNYLAHFALTAVLMPALLRSVRARVVNVTSLAQNYAKLDLSDLQRERNYRPAEAYCQSKLAQAMFTRELQRRSDASHWGLISVAAHPGYASTNLFQNEQGPNSLLNLISTKLIVPLIGQSAEAGAQPILYAATEPEVVPGGLYGPQGFMNMKGRPGPGSYGKPAMDDALARQLWDMSLDLARVEFSSNRTAQPG